MEIIRHYLPSIAAGIALLVVVFITPFSDQFAKDHHIDSLKASSVSADTGNKCTETTVGVSLLLNVDTKTPTEFTDDAITGKDAFGNWWGDSLKAPYSPPLLLEKSNIGCCFGAHKFFLNGAEVLNENWQGSLKKDYTSQPGGGILFDTYQNFTSNGAFMHFQGATYLKFANEHGVVNTVVNPSDSNTVDAGSIKDILGGTFKDSGSGASKVSQVVKITASGQGRIGLGAANSGTNRDQSDGSITLDSSKDDFSQHLFVCKDSQNNGICDSEECSTARAPACSDGLDNDGDHKIDFPADPGCSSPDDTDETDAPPPPINRNITLKRSATPTIIVQPILKDREVITFNSTCASCTIKTDPDPSKFKGGSAEAAAGFTIFASLINSADKSISTTILITGDAVEDSPKLVTATGNEYVSLGPDADTQYPVSFLASADNDYSLKARINGQFEQIKLTPTVLPAFDGVPLKNGSIYSFVFQGVDSNGKKHLVQSKGRYWDPATFANATATPEPYFSFFKSMGSLSQCTSALQSYPNFQTLFDNPSGFELFLDLMSLCQRAPAPPPPPPAP